MSHLSRLDFLDILSNGKLSARGDQDENHPAGPESEAYSEGAEAAGMAITPYIGKWGDEEKLHLLRRCLFGVTNDDVHFFSSLTLAQALDVLLTPPPVPEPPVNAYNDDKYQDPTVPFGKTWVSALQTDSDANYKRLNSLYAWWIGLMLRPQHSISQKMVLFWTNHMVCEVPLTYDARSSYGYLDIIMRGSLGNFKKLILDLTTCPAMLQYLSGNESTVEAPNENYSREMQELFTVGKGPDSHYTQDDINAAARVLTGWTTTPNGMEAIFNAAMHDSNDKHFSAFYNNTVIKGRSGKEGTAETKELIDMIFGAKEVARHTCRCLYRWFVNSEIDTTIETAIIQPLAELLIKSKFEIVPVLKALLGSQHFFAATNIGCQIKNPVDYTIGFSRQLHITSFPSDLTKEYMGWNAVVERLRAQAMCPGEPPNVAGWPAYYLSPGYCKLWINADTMVQRNSAIDSLTSDQGLTQGVTIKFDLLGFTSQMKNPSDPNQLIADTVRLLSPLAFGPTHTGNLKKILDPESDSQSWSALWAAYAASPDNQEIKNKTWGRLSAYYNYILKRAECHLM